MAHRRVNVSKQGVNSLQFIEQWQLLKRNASSFNCALV